MGRPGGAPPERRARRFSNGRLQGDTSGDGTAGAAVVVTGSPLPSRSPSGEAGTERLR